MIRVGILSEANSVARSTLLINKFRELKLTGISAPVFGVPDKMIVSQAGELINGSDAIYLETPSPGLPLLRAAIRKSSHIFTRFLPRLTIPEIKNLICLGNEAGSVIQIFNPYIFLSESLDIYGDLLSPLLINIRMAASPGTTYEDQLVYLILYLIHQDKTGSKKTEALMLESDDHSFVLDLRISFHSGTVGHLVFSSRFTGDQSMIEIFRKDDAVISFQLAPLNDTKLFTSEQNALRHFVSAIKNRPAILVSLNELLQARNILHEITEKLKYSGSSLLV
ncbi:hypothetical protein [Gaoshiqia sp. Z1-71]|uniref:hypothetical protein n=1 Tax=Gaoshiqia hydrogeniformans TaxID=3290090 RepID=UPI003BF7B457